MRLSGKEARLAVVLGTWRETPDGPKVTGDLAIEADVPTIVDALVRCRDADTIIAEALRFIGRPKHRGFVKWFNAERGYGFIRQDDGKEIFVHHSRVVDGGLLIEGERVEFVLGDGQRGPMAVDVIRT